VFVGFFEVTLPSTFWICTKQRPSKPTINTGPEHENSQQPNRQAQSKANQTPRQPFLTELPTALAAPLPDPPHRLLNTLTATDRTQAAGTTSLKGVS